MRSAERIVDRGETGRNYPRETHRRMGRRALRSVEKQGRGEVPAKERPPRTTESLGKEIEVPKSTDETERMAAESGSVDAEQEQAEELSEQERMEQNDRLLSEFDDSGIKMSKFLGIYGARAILSNQEWALMRARQQAETVKSPEAEQFEEIFIQGINIGNWLGNLTSAEQGGLEFEAFAWKAALLDDLSNRVDDVVELKFAEPIQGEDEKLSLDGIKLGFDVTTNPSRKVIREKLTKSCNDPRKLPFGFSRLSYYENGDERGPVKRLPRYTIGLSSYDIQDIWRDSEVDTRYGGKIRKMQPSAETRFKVLTEIRAQNELFYAMLPDNADETLRLELEATDECLQSALMSCTKEIVGRGQLPKAVLDKIRAERESLAEAGARNVTVRDRAVIEEYLLASSHARFQDGKQGQKRRHRKRREDDEDDPFVQIVTEARQLTAMAQRGELDKYRKPRPRNRAF